MMNNDSRTLTTLSASQTVAIGANDMIYITWKHATIRLNVTGLIYLGDFLTGKHLRQGQRIGFHLSGNQDDGYQLWVQEVGLRLTCSDFERFKCLVLDAVSALRQMGTPSPTSHLPDSLKLTVEVAPTAAYYQN